MRAIVKKKVLVSMPAVAAVGLFAVTDFSGYAVSGTAPVPVPAAVWLLGSGLAGLGFVRRRRKKSA